MNHLLGIYYKYITVYLTMSLKLKFQAVCYKTFFYKLCVCYKTGFIMPALFSYGSGLSHYRINIT